MMVRYLSSSEIIQGKSFRTKSRALRSLRYLFASFVRVDILSR